MSKIGKEQIPSQDNQEHSTNPDKTNARVNAMAEQLKEAGYDFKLDDNGTEFVIKTQGHEFHVMKIDPFTLEYNGVKIKGTPIEKIVMAYIVNPDGNVYETIHSEG